MTTILDVESFWSGDAATTTLMKNAIGIRKQLLSAASGSLIALPADKLTRADLESELGKPVYNVLGCLAHGVRNAILGENLLPMLDTQTAASLVKNRVICLTACSAGLDLMAALRQKGARAVFAYDADLIFDAASIDPLIRCCATADLSALAGRSPSAIESDVRTAFDHAITAASAGSNVAVEAHLRWAAECFVVSY